MTDTVQHLVTRTKWISRSAWIIGVAAVLLVSFAAVESGRVAAFNALLLIAELHQQSAAIDFSAFSQSMSSIGHRTPPILAILGAILQFKPSLVVLGMIALAGLLVAHDKCAVEPKRT